MSYKGLLCVAACLLPGCQRVKASSLEAGSAAVSGAPALAAASAAPTAAARQPRKFGPIRTEPILPPEARRPPKGARSYPSGLVTQLLRAGNGDVHPNKTDRVMIEFAGFTPDGKSFGRSRKPQRVALSDVIVGWREALLTMVEGEQRRLWVPAELAYGAAAGAQRAPAGDLIYDLTLRRLIAPPPTPTHLSAPPRRAVKERSGLAHLVLEEGTGRRHPGPTSAVEINSTGWTAAGRMFHSHAYQDMPTRKRLNQLPPGFAEGLALMVVGERRRLWIPAPLGAPLKSSAGGTAARRPPGPIVIDVELLRLLD